MEMVKESCEGMAGRRRLCEVQRHVRAGAISFAGRVPGSGKVADRAV